MTLRELRAARPDMFHPTQDWYFGQAFMDVMCSDEPIPPPTFAFTGDGNAFAHAVELALSYVTQPHASIWGRYLWTRDLDQYGQRVYVGTNGRGLEIHRHIRLTERFGWPVWTA